jgi:hypothetical protein
MKSSFKKISFKISTIYTILILACNMLKRIYKTSPRRKYKMKKVVSTIVAALVAVAFAGIAFAAEPSTPATPAAPVVVKETKKPVKKHLKKKVTAKKTVKKEEVPAVPATPEAK